MNAPIRRTGVMRMMDTLASMITGLNTSKDRSTGLTWAVNELNQSVVEAMYRGDWIARKIINAPAQDSTRQWRQWQADNDQIEEIEKIEKLFHIQSRTKTALIKARLYGGAALILGVEDGKDPSEELDLESIRKDSLKFVHAVSKHELFNEAGNFETDLMSPYFGQPKMYARQVKGGAQIRIHPSRIIRIMGEEYPDPNMSSDSWGESILQSVHDACRNAGLITQSVATLMDEMKVDVIKIPDLTRQLGDQESSDRLTERLSYGMLSKSTVNALVMDKDDEWETRTQNLAGLPDIIKTYLQIAAGAADIPATRLLGQSPSGLSATGESDIRNYYDHISSEQVNTLSPALDRLDQIIIRSALGMYDESIFYEWNPLWQMTEMEQADIAAKRAATFKVDVDTMIVPTDALKEGRINQLIEAGTYPGLEQAIEDSDGEVVNPKLEAQLALAEKNAELNPPVPPKPGEKVVPFKKKAPAIKDAFDPNQPRNEQGEWTEGGSKGNSESKGEWSGTGHELERAALGKNKLTPDEEKAVNEYVDYTGQHFDFAEVNRRLRNYSSLDEDEAKGVKELQSAINKSSLPRNMTVHRGIVIGKNDAGEVFGDKLVKKLEGMKLREHFVDPGFMSTSLGAGVASDFGPEEGDREGALMRIHAKKGDKALPTQSGREAEIIFQRGTRLRYLGKIGNTYILETAGVARMEKDDSNFTDSTPRTLYVRRDVLNGNDIVKWAKDQGFQSTLPASDMHVTIAFSKSEVDWMKVAANEFGYSQNEDGGLRIPPGGARVVEKFNGGACVLLFNSSALSWRHEDIKRAGASWDWPEYQPHITFHYYGEGEEEIDLTKITPYRGEIILGPEIFEEINGDWKSNIKER